MAHWRKRLVESQIKSALKWSPCVVIMGMRQTGKTSLLRRLTERYLTFDDDALPALFEREGESLLGQGPFPLALDEVQKFPKVFDRIKIAIDRAKTPGRFLITGSVRFSQKRDIRESLTGRTAPFELLPLSLAEAHDKLPFPFLDEVLEKTPAQFLAKRKAKVWATFSQVVHHQVTGGLPGICFKRDRKVRNRLFEQHLDTILGRDIHLLTETKLRATELQEILSFLFSQQGMPITFASMARQFGYSAPTIRRIVDAFEGLFLIRRLGDAYYAEDQGLAHFCTETLHVSDRSRWLGFLHHEVRSQTAQVGPGVRLADYRTRGGAEVPFVAHIPGKGVVAMALDAKEHVSEKTLKSLGSIAKKQRGKARLVVFHLGENAYLSSKEVLCLPLTWIA